MTATDFYIINHGSVVSLHPLTVACRDWVDENVHSEGWQWLGGGLAIEPRYANDLIAGLIDAGFKADEQE